MKITGTKSYIDVETNGRTVRIEGELTTTPTFYANINSIKYWSFPHQHIEITEEEKGNLIQLVIDETHQPGKVPVFFD